MLEFPREECAVRTDSVRKIPYIVESQDHYELLKLLIEQSGFDKVCLTRRITG